MHTNSPHRVQGITDCLKKEIVVLGSVYGELSDELHYFWLSVRKESFLVCLDQSSQFLDEPFLEHV